MQGEEGMEVKKRKGAIEQGEKGRVRERKVGKIVQGSQKKHSCRFRILLRFMWPNTRNTLSRKPTKLAEFWN